MYRTDGWKHFLITKMPTTRGLGLGQDSIWFGEHLRKNFSSKWLESGTNCLMGGGNRYLKSIWMSNWTIKALHKVLVNRKSINRWLMVGLEMVGWRTCFGAVSLLLANTISYSLKDVCGRDIVVYSLHEGNCGHNIAQRSISTPGKPMTGGLCELMVVMWWCFIGSSVNFLCISDKVEETKHGV